MFKNAIRLAFVVFDEPKVPGVGAYCACYLACAFLEIKLWSYADARVARCRNASNFAFIWSCEVKHTPCGTRGNTWSTVLLPTLQDAVAQRR